MSENLLQQFLESNIMTQNALFERIQHLETGMNHNAKPIIKPGKVLTFTGVNTNAIEVKGFLASLNLNFAAINLTDNRQKVMYFGSYLAKTAGIWFEGIIEASGGYDEISYEQLVEAFKGRFLASDYAEDARHRLEKLRQTGPVEHYIKLFAEQAAMLRGVYDSDEYRLDQFIEGLKPEVQAALSIYDRDTLTLQQAYQKAQTLDAIYWKKHLSQKSSSRPTANRLTRQGFRNAEVMDLDEMSQQKVNYRRRQYKDKDKPALCFTCQQPGHFARDCPSKASTHPGLRSKRRSNPGLNH